MKSSLRARTVAAFGSWRSPISPEQVVSGALRFGDLHFEGEHLYWIEERPAEAGRNVIVRGDRYGQVEDVLPRPFNARTKVHEYGGAAYLVSDETVWFSNFEDQRLYRLDPGRAPWPITAERPWRYADGVFERSSNRIITVREDHRGQAEAVNTIVSLDAAAQSEQAILVSGSDFYAAPRISPDGRFLCWLSWNHPNMPWDGTQLWLAELDARKAEVRNPRRVAGGETDSIFQPAWSPDGILYFCSDRTGYWNIYRLFDEKLEPVLTMEAELGEPAWIFGFSVYDFQSEEKLVVRIRERAIDRLASLDLRTKHLEPIETPCTFIYPSIAARGGEVAFIGGSPVLPESIATVDPRVGETEIIRSSASSLEDPDLISPAQPIDFPTERGLTAHAFFYAPRNPEFEGPADQLPPLLVWVHGGPNGSVSNALDIEKQFWTSRGFAIVDVNYGGSTGFGREYRKRLEGQWGIVDVEDCINASRYLAERKLIDPKRVVITGGSAGGYTTLRAISSTDYFALGASLYGISDLEALARDTHKFESRLLDRLVAPYPEQAQVYRDRSPIHSIDRLQSPAIIFQGLEDAVVPPNQATMIVDALKRKGLPVAYLAFEGEQHGFRKAGTIKRVLEAELYFYSRIFGFDLPEPVEPVTVDNLK